MSLQELAVALQETNEQNYGGSSIFNFDISREQRCYEEGISRLLKQQHPELNDAVVWIRQKIEWILAGIRQNDPLIIAEYVPSALAA